VYFAYAEKEIQADYLHELKTIKFEEGDLEAIKRITYAEAMDQGGLGITAVIFVILNRQLSGKYGASIQEVMVSRLRWEALCFRGSMDIRPFKITK
jgi:hypothetical protein